MIKKVMICLVCTLLMISCGFAEDLSVGGHVKLVIFDRSSGEHNQAKSSAYTGMGVSTLYLSFYKQITQTFTVEIQPEWVASTGATPKFGANIGDQKIPAGDVEPEFHGWSKFLLKTLLPGQFELSFGIVKPQWTWDYGAELFWEDQIIGGKFSNNDFLGSAHETGFELYRTFEAGRFSIPAYLYLLNGGNNEFSDNNRGPMVMLNVEPECGPIRLKAGIATGKYDDAGDKQFLRYMAGAGCQIGCFSARAEMAGGNWEKSIANSEDAKPRGYYAKAFYRCKPWLKFMIHYDHVNNNYSGFFYTAPGEEIYKTITPGVQIFLTGSTIIQTQFDIADWKQTSPAGETDRLKFSRLVLGIRSTF